VWYAVEGVMLALQGATDQATALFEEALGHWPGIEIGPDDMNPSIAMLFKAARDRALPTATFISFGPEQITVNRDLLWLRVRARRSERVSVLLRDGITGRAVWRVEQPVDSTGAISWDGKRNADGESAPVASGRYELVVVPFGRRGMEGNGFTKWLDLRTTPPDTSAHFGAIPDSALVRETLGTGTRVGSVLQGVFFGAAAVGLGIVADVGWNGSDPARRSGTTALGIGVVAAGLVGALLLDTDRPLPDRVRKNEQARARWELQRRELIDLNATRLLQPYPLTVKVVE
jgi:hypothetical protein